MRDQAFKALAAFVKKLEAHAETMPETVLPPPGSEGVVPTAYGSAVPATTSAAVLGSATGAAGMLAGWAMSSLGSKARWKLTTETRH